MFMYLCVYIHIYLIINKFHYVYSYISYVNLYIRISLFKFDNFTNARSARAGSYDGKIFIDFCNIDMAWKFSFELIRIVARL